MTRWASFAILALSCLALASPLSASAQTARDGKIRILGRATVEAVPDYAIVRVGITTKAASPTAALDQNSAIARKMIDFSKKFGIQEEDIQTESVRLSPTTRSVTGPKGDVRLEPDGYTANNTVRVKFTELPRLGTFMRQMLDQGATNIAGVEFGLSNIDQVTDDARVKAVENAFHQAQRLADAAKVKLGPIVEIVHPPRAQFQPFEGAADMPVRPLRRAAVPIEVGTIRVAAEVDMTWAIQ